MTLLLRCLLVLIFTLPLHANADEKHSITLIAKAIIALPLYITFNNTDKGLTLCSDNPKILQEAKIQNNKKNRFTEMAYLKRDILYKKCNLAFISNKQSARKKITRNPRGTILLSNYSGFINEGGDIAIIERAGKLNIELNLGSIAMKEVSVSSDLIEISARVIR